ncbi:YiiD C-terminal domain-containing protein [Nonomuraea sp. CA-218870]|uniref:YiiD C-terminal domain-containing protein n=1 Tax=Nonomuraea sp. CA-218870 TaxID=3239998 RepID=UPI003D8CFE32
MSLDIGDLLIQSVPFARTLGITFDSAADGRAVSRLPDRPDLHNHVGGPHAGALFTLAEAASGAAMLTAFGDQLSRAVPLVAASTVRYLKPAKGEIVASARLLASRDEVVPRLDAGERPEFDVEVEVRNEEGTPVATLTFSWTLLPSG